MILSNYWSILWSDLAVSLILIPFLKYFLGENKPFASYRLKSVSVTFVSGFLVRGSPINGQASVTGVTSAVICRRSATPKAITSAVHKRKALQDVFLTKLTNTYSEL
jgi:hypothetical protein